MNKFKTSPFDLKNSLCRFLIVENNENHTLYGVFHHLIFDGLSKPVFEKDLKSLLEGKSLKVDDSFLKVSAFAKQISKTEEYKKAFDFYQHMLADTDEAGVLLEDI
ncbi:condensation domain-containing protein [Methanobrevibacter millerae]|uniref:condensation domain-containing protein n=1 Tax=Methanobrevibacter millerae TaxID=230361 RepID=UPI0026EC6A01|nr:condensation domain-containing protein [Methanobrevibacter millerae]